MKQLIFSRHIDNWQRRILEPTLSLPQRTHIFAPMLIQHNPFLSPTFTAVWSKHFAAGETLHTSDFLPSLKFTKHKKLPLYTNVGQTFTKGINYHINLEKTLGFNNKVFLIYDIPGYFEVNTQTTNDIGLHRSKQYPGFLIDLTQFKDLNSYLASAFSKSSRYKLKKYKKRFETSFDVRYVMYKGAMSRDSYDEIFESFRQLLEKRFHDKQITNNNLDPKEWKFYHEVTYPMLLEGKASLFVIYDGKKPIGVTLNFFSENILFDAITVFDIDYAKFHLGSITIMALLEWCLENNLKTFDFSKGFYDYKTRWATTTYDFEYHIYYDTKSILARSIALSLKKFFELKQQLRQKDINEKVHRLTYRFKNRNAKPKESKTYVFTEITDDIAVDDLRSLSLEKPENRDLKLMVFEYLYLNDDQYRDIIAYAVPNTTDNFYIIGKTKKTLATLAYETDNQKHQN
ncbi:hypothetical protein LCGC14_1047340 [marine sediment metagenome]|uniref:BioF2-like acetyltransferase domain-containing protein n=1 Tax=marine sediment metagenome TaxID=412755 RepID=A0A0F9MPX5_9ZZZZ